MTEKEQEYLELYPIYKTLCQEIDSNFIQNNKIVSVSGGTRTFVDSTFGRILYTKDITNVSVSYHLSSFKYKQLIETELLKRYSEYYGVKIEEANVEKGFMREACDLIVKVDCASNKRRYMKLGVVEKQSLLQEAVLNIQNGIVVFDDEPQEYQAKK